MTKPVLLMLGSYPPADMQALEADFEVLKLWEQPDEQRYLAAQGPRVRALATRGDLGANSELLAKLPNLEVIGCFGVGVDGINLSICNSRGIKVANTPDVLSDDVADLALALMLGIARQIPQADAFTRSAQWSKGSFPLLTRMHGKRLGILGLGRIGLAIAKRAQAFDMSIAYHTRKRREDVAYNWHPSPSALAKASDFLIVIVPGGSATEKMVNAEVLAALGPKGFLINVARGSVVDEEALLAALEAGTIAGAALDVFWNEPNINPRFFALNNVVLHPHGGSGTVETRAAMGKLVRDNLQAHFAGKPLLTPVK